MTIEANISNHNSSRSTSISQLSVTDLVVKRIQLLAQNRVHYLRYYWQKIGRGENNEVSYHAIVDGILQAENSDATTATWIANNPDIQKNIQVLKIIEAEIEQRSNSRFALIQQIFGLTKEEVDYLQVTFVQNIVPEMRQVFAYLHDHANKTYLSASLVQALFGHPSSLVLTTTSPLKIWDIIQEKPGNIGEEAALNCSPFIGYWLSGSNDLDDILLEVARVQNVQPALPNWPLQETLDWINRISNTNNWQRIRISVLGVPGSGRRSFAATLMAQFNMPLLVIDTNRIDEQNWAKVWKYAQRQAYLNGCALMWVGEQVTEKWWPNMLPPVRLQFLSCEADERAKPIEGIVDFRISLPSFSIVQRREIWSAIAPQLTHWPQETFLAFTQRYQATIGQMYQVSQQQIDTPEEAAECLQESARHQLGQLAQHLKCPFIWSDLIIPNKLKKHLEDFVFEAEHRERLWEQTGTRRLFPQGRGLMALLTGPPGTGKTMAAQVIAASLKRDLFRINLATVVSKYVGETSKNLNRILARAQGTQAILLFDEADALFGKRTDVKDAHDRFANTDTNYLLQAIESYEGIAILATNKKGNIDYGFMRRLRYVLEFSKPDIQQRFLIWKNLLQQLGQESVQHVPDTTIRQLAEVIKLTGAQIKFIILSALFMAQKEGKNLNTRHILLGLERELMKEGYSISKEIRQMILSLNM